MNGFTLIYFMKFIILNGIGNLLNLFENYDHELEYICKLKYGKELKFIDCSNKYSKEQKNNKYIFIKGNEIEEKYFANCSKITKIIIANSIKSINNFAFYNCSS